MNPDPPAYLVHPVVEKDMTIDWFFGRGHAGMRVQPLDGVGGVAVEMHPDEAVI